MMNIIFVFKFKQQINRDRNIFYSQNISKSVLVRYWKKVEKGIVKGWKIVYSNLFLYREKFQMRCVWMHAIHVSVPWCMFFHVAQPLSAQLLTVIINIPCSNGYLFNGKCKIEIITKYLLNMKHEITMQELVYLINKLYSILK